jgi:hypothetical protein
MKKFLLLTVCAFGVSDLVPTADLQASEGALVLSSSGPLTKNQKKRLRQKVAKARKAVANNTAIPLPSSPEPKEDLGAMASDIENKSMSEAQALANVAATYRRIKDDGRSDMKTVTKLIQTYSKKSQFSQAFKKKLQAINDAIANGNQQRVASLLGLDVPAPSGKTVDAAADAPAKTMPVSNGAALKAWDKNITAVKGSLSTLKTAVGRIENSLDTYSNDDQAKDQKAIDQMIGVLLKAIDSMEGSIDSLGRFKANASIQQYLVDFAKNLQAQLQEAFLSTAKRRKAVQIDASKVTISTESIGAIKERLQTLTAFLQPHRKFLGKMKSTPSSSQALSATYVLDAGTSRAEIKGDDAFKPAVDSSMFDGKKDKELPKTLKTLQSLVNQKTNDIKALLEAPLGKKGELLKKKAEFLINKVQRSSEINETKDKVQELLYEGKKSDVKNILVQLETYRQELDHMLGALKGAQEKSQGSTQAKADYDMIINFHEKLGDVIGKMAARSYGNVQELKPLLLQWMPKQQDTLKILSLKDPKEKEKRLAEIKGWLEILNTVR